MGDPSPSLWKSRKICVTCGGVDAFIRRNGHRFQLCRRRRGGVSSRAGPAPGGAARRRRAGPRAAACRTAGTAEPQGAAEGLDAAAGASPDADLRRQPRPAAARPRRARPATGQGRRLPALPRARDRARPGGRGPQVDYASDENPKKDVARKMIQMVMAVNDDYLKDVGDAGARRRSAATPATAATPKSRAWRRQTAGAAAASRCSAGTGRCRSAERRGGGLTPAFMRRYRQSSDRILCAALFLWASTNVWLRRTGARERQFVRRSVARFMPGERVEDAIDAAGRLKPLRHQHHPHAPRRESVAHLGEADEVCRHYLDVLDLVRRAGLDAQISVKPTQLGYDQDVEVCFRLARDAARGGLGRRHVAVARHGELARTSTARWRSTDGCAQQSPRVGVALQAYLRRTERDLEALVPLGAAIRLVKGAYLEPASVAFPQQGGRGRELLPSGVAAAPGRRATGRARSCTWPPTTVPCRSGFVR